MYTLELGVSMYKYSINDLPVAFKEYFMKRSDIHDYPTRHVNNLNPTNNRKSFSDPLEFAFKNNQRIQICKTFP